jgi:hypothetical protein
MNNYPLYIDKLPDYPVQVPKDVIRYKIREREGYLPVIFLAFEDRIEEHFIFLHDRKIIPDERIIGINYKSVTKKTTLDKLKGKPSYAEINSACMWYNHGFGVMDKDECEKIRFEAEEWLMAWKKVYDISFLKK